MPMSCVRSRSWSVTHCRSLAAPHGATLCDRIAVSLLLLVLLVVAQGGNHTSAIATGAGSVAAWPFILCMEQNHANLSSLSVCASKAEGLTVAGLDECVGKRYYQVMHEGAVVTEQLCQVRVSPPGALRGGRSPAHALSP